MDDVNAKDWCEKPRVAGTLGKGWCVRIDGTDVFDSINQYGCKTRRSFDVVKGLGSKEEADAYLAQWLKDQLPDFDAQRLRANTAELDRLAGEYQRLQDAHGSAEQRIAELLALIQKAHTWVDRNNFGGWDAYELRDELAVALNPKPEAGSHE